MSLLRLILRTLKHYVASNLATAGGIAVSTAIICGALIIGDSLSESLMRLVDRRLGDVTHTITAGERIFSQELSERISHDGQHHTASILKTEASITLQGSQTRVNQVDVWGIDAHFAALAAPGRASFMPADNEVIINDRLAQRLMVDTGDYLLFRMKSIGPIPVNTPFVSESDQTITRRLRIRAVLQDGEGGRFSLQASQSAPMNAFVSIDWLNRVMGLESMANMMLVATAEETSLTDLYQQLKAAWRPADGALTISTKPGPGNTPRLHITSGRVFIDHYLSATISQVFPEQQQTLTYFVNSISYRDAATPYSFVAAIDRNIYHGGSNTPTNGTAPPIQHQAIEAGQTLINQWLADDLGVTPGDSVTMRYYEIGPLRELIEREERFLVSGIISMQDAMKDSILMPHLPGLSDAGSCSDWEAGIPIDLGAIRQQDEDYWDVFKGTPKAYIALKQGQELWQNRFGNLTTVSIPESMFSPEEAATLLATHTDPVRLGFLVRPVREQGIMAAKNSVDFGELFAALGIFIIISGLLLTTLLLGFNLERRKGQIQLMHAVGFPPHLIRKTLMGEASVIALAGALTGGVLSVLYSKMIFHVLNNRWYDIIRTDTLELYFQPASIAAGLAISLILGLAAVYWRTRKAVTKGLFKTTDGKHEKYAKRHAKIIAVSGLTMILMAAGLAIFLGMGQHFDAPFAWLGAGALLLTASLAGILYFLFYHEWPLNRSVNMGMLSWKNLVRNPKRSFITILLLALGSFVIVVTASNRKEAVKDDTIISSGTGGFQFMAETTAPILRDLNHHDIQTELAIPPHTRFVQFMTAFDDDASCLNLNMVANPRIIATSPELLEGRFRFTTKHHQLDPDHPWLSLNNSMDNIIPAIADQSVIQWGLGKKTGDTLYYSNASGEEIRLLLVGGLANSVFQGNVIISADNFLKHFPDAGGSHVFLMETTNINANDLAEELGMIFRDHGWEIHSTLAILSSFDSVENTYLQIFFLMGAFGMLLGTIGLVVIMAKSMVERQAETALLDALGFKKITVSLLFSREYALLLITGIITGLLAGMLATLPNFITANQNVSAGYLIAVIMALLINGLVWIAVIPWVRINRASLTKTLVNE